MKKKNIDAWNYLLMHLRLSSKLTIRDICRQTGIPQRIYNQMEAGTHTVSSGEAELLGTLFSIDPYYLSQHSYQLQLIIGAKYLLAHKQERIVQLTRVVKRKINAAKKQNR